MNIIILTGNELRHVYFRKKLSQNHKMNILRSYCESDKNSLENRVKSNNNASEIEIRHAEARKQSENDFFGEVTYSLSDYSKPKIIEKGTINDIDVVNEIIELSPDLLVCYGSSIIKSDLVEKYSGKFLNVHLGLSPYYRGSGTNVWPIINNEFEYIGATFMYLDAGIDTGEIIHQIQARIFIGDSPHSIGNRLIRDMVETYAEIIMNFKNLTKEPQIPEVDSKFYRRKDFDKDACEKLYANINNLHKIHIDNQIDLIKNKGLTK